MYTEVVCVCGGVWGWDCRCAGWGGGWCLNLELMRGPWWGEGEKRRRITLTSGRGFPFPPVHWWTGGTAISLETVATRFPCAKTEKPPNIPQKCGKPRMHWNVSWTTEQLCGQIFKRLCNENDFPSKLWGFIRSATAQSAGTAPLSPVISHFPSHQNTLMISKILPYIVLFSSGNS